jgi:hypothetical protein
MSKTYVEERLETVASSSLFSMEPPTGSRFMTVVGEEKGFG